MQSLPSSSSNSENTAIDTSLHKGKSLWIAAVTWLLRLVTGALFTFSGFVKGIDAWGTIYKLDEYLAALGVPMSHSLVVVCVYALCILEFMIGIYMLFGCYRRSNCILALLFMIVMLPLTLWIAIADPVADCGCFGDAYIISNWSTFWKNVILTACIVWLLKYNKSIPCIITPAFQWIAFIATALFLFCICWYGYNIQPMIDFRPYKTGTMLIDESQEEDEPQYVFVYSKEGTNREFTEDNIPDDNEGWTFVSRREIHNSASKAMNGHSFSVMDKAGDEDATEDAIDAEGREFILLIPSLKEISASTTYKINMLFDWAQAHDIGLIAIVAANTGSIPEWEDLSMPRYEIYTADDTSIKELARGNPSVVFLDKGVIKWKSTLTALNEDSFATPDTDSDVNEMATDGKKDLHNLTLIYLLVLAFLTCISMIPKLSNIFRPMGYKGPQNIKEYKEIKAARANRDDKARREE